MRWTNHREHLSASILFLSHQREKQGSTACNYITPAHCFRNSRARPHTPRGRAQRISESWKGSQASRPECAPRKREEWMNHALTAGAPPPLVSRKPYRSWSFVCPIRKCRQEKRTVNKPHFQDRTSSARTPVMQKQIGIFQLRRFRPTTVRSRRWRVSRVEIRRDPTLERSAKTRFTCS